jgi:CBS domain-containing membrane protein
MRWIMRLGSWWGVELDPVSLKEKGVSTLGGLVAIFSVMVLSRNLLDGTGAGMVTASMGASAVLLFAVPHGQLSQPWPVLAGHVFSAVLGVFCARTIPWVPLAAACAVGVSIAVMHQLKCIHPPGGATALTAVIGGEGVRALGYSFVWSPVFLNASMMVLIAIVFNFSFRWRRYPACWQETPAREPGDEAISHEEVVSALESFDSFVDITEDDLIRLHHLLARRVKKNAGVPKIPGSGKAARPVAGISN